MVRILRTLSIPEWAALTEEELSLLEIDPTCGGYIFDEYGRARIAVDQSTGGGRNYPFVTNTELRQLVADFYLSYADNTSSFVHPFRIRWLSGFGCEETTSISDPPVVPHQFDMVVEDAVSAIVFDSTLADEPQVRDWGNLKIVEWILGESILRVVYFLAWTEDEVPLSFPFYMEPIDAVLQERTYTQLPPRLRSIRVEGGNKLVPFPVFANGYNTVLDLAPKLPNDGGRYEREITFNAAPGSGKGRYGPACDDPEPRLFRLNNVGPDSSGNITLDAADCFRESRPVVAILDDPELHQVRVRGHASQLFNDCSICYDCDDVISVYQALRLIRNRLASVRDRAVAVRNTYIANRNRMVADAACRASTVTRAALRPIYPNQLGVVIGYCNNTGACQSNVIIVISFQYQDEAGDLDPTIATPTPLSAVTTVANSGPPYATITTPMVDPPSIVALSTMRMGNSDSGDLGVSRSQYEKYRLGGKWPIYHATFNKIDAGRMGTVTFRLDFPNGVTSDAVEMIVDVYVAPEGLVTDSIDNPIFQRQIYGVPITDYKIGAGPMTPGCLLTRMGTPLKRVSGLLTPPGGGDDSISDIYPIP